MYQGASSTVCSPSLGRRGATRSLGLQRRVFTPDEGSPHFERHWRLADSSSAPGPCKNREHSEISRSQNRIGAFPARRVAKIAKPTGSKLVKSPAESGEICSVEVEEK